MVDLVQRQVRTAVRGIVGGFKGVEEHAAQGLQRPRSAIARHGFLRDPIESAEVVKPGHVIGVMMREEDGIDAANVVGETLEAKLRAGVDEEANFAQSQPDAGAGAFVAQVGRSADAAVASDHGNAMGGAAAEDDHVDLGHAN